MLNSKDGHRSRSSQDGKNARPNHSEDQFDKARRGGQLSLWERAHRGDDDAIADLVKQHETIAIFMAKAFEGRGIGREELVDQAKHGLRIAAFEFQTTRSTNFQAFAKTVVKNYLADLFRKRSLRTRHETGQAAKFEESRARLAHQLERAPTEEETYEELGWSETERRNHAFAQQRFACTSIERSVELTGELPENKTAVNPVHECCTAEESKSLQTAIAGLDDASRRVIVERFYSPDCPSQKETANRLGITEYRERLLEEHALETLKRSIEGTVPPMQTETRGRENAATKGA